jgi:hypothetical protein
VVVDERFPGELETLRADNERLRRLLKLSEEQARAADPDQATLSGAPESPVSMASTPEDKIKFYLDLFRSRPDVYALRWENRRDGRFGWMPAIRGYWRKGMNRAYAPYLSLTADVIAQHLAVDAVDRSEHVAQEPLFALLEVRGESFVEGGAIVVVIPLLHPHPREIRKARVRISCGVRGSR